MTENKKSPRRMSPRQVSDHTEPTAAFVVVGRDIEDNDFCVISFNKVGDVIKVVRWDHSHDDLIEAEADL